MIAYAFHRRFHITQIHRFIMWMFGISRHPKLLPYEESHFITQLIKIIGFGNTASPETDQIYTRLFRITQFGIRSFI